jgi:protocatechuate 3,4-dioxygenase beta subunit
MIARKEISRRGLLGMLAGSGAALAFGCGDTVMNIGGASTGGSATGGGGAGGSTASTTASTGTGGGACAVTPEGEIGPYFTDDSASGFNRSNIVANVDGTEAQEGIPLTLTITVVDTEKSCAPYVGAQVDIWHCNAAGVYSNEASESTTTQTWLRGYQLTDGSGQVTFTTVIPGWYSGRTTHIHLRVRSSYSDASSTMDGTNTTQLFFDQTLIDGLATSVTPYSSEGTNPTTNASDHVYTPETKGETLMTLSGDATSGYTAVVTIGLPITS